MKSDLKSIKLLAVDYLKLEPSVNEAYPFIVYHPFIDRNPVAFIENNKLVLIDIINDEENLNKYLKQKEADIMSAKNLDEMFVLRFNNQSLIEFLVLKDYYDQICTDIKNIAIERDIIVPGRLINVDE